MLAGKLQSQLGVDIVAREQVTITCQSDDEPETQLQLDASEPVTLKGARTIRIQTPSLQLTIRSGSQEVATLLAEHDRLTVLFNRDLAPFNLTADSFVDQLPHMQQLLTTWRGCRKNKSGLIACHLSCSSAAMIESRRSPT